MQSVGNVDTKKPTTGLRNQMFTKIATLTLAVAFLSAGAFAGARDLTAGSSVTKTVNMTVVSKNQSWPVRGQVTVETCKLNACLDI